MAKKTPQIKTVEIIYKERSFTLEYFCRQGDKETVLLIHGLGGAKENYFEACKSDALAEHTLISFDNLVQEIRHTLMISLLMLMILQQLPPFSFPG